MAKEMKRGSIRDLGPGEHAYVNAEPIPYREIMEANYPECKKHLKARPIKSYHIFLKNGIELECRSLYTATGGLSAFEITGISDRTPTDLIPVYGEFTSPFNHNAVMQFQYSMVESITLCYGEEEVIDHSGKQS